MMRLLTLLVAESVSLAPADGLHKCAFRSSQPIRRIVLRRPGVLILREDIALASLGVPSARSATHPSPRAIVAHRTNASPAQHRRADQFSPARPRLGSLREDT